MSPHTVCSYRDAVTLLLRFLAELHDRDVVKLDFDDLSPDSIIAFLAHLEEDRHNTAATRNSRLAAIHSFARFAATNHPEHLELCQRVLAVPFKRARPRLVEYLEAREISAILDAPDRASPDGRRDHALMLTLFNTGARVQEILDVRPSDLQLVRPLQVRLRGKGRKERICPLWPRTVKVLRAFLTESGVEPTSTQQLFRNRRGEPLTRFGVRYLLRKHTEHATTAVKTLAAKRVHPHVIRHTTAVHLLQAGVDLVTIGHWLGHASVETTNRYAAVDLETKRAAVAKARPVGRVAPAVAAWAKDRTILQWLESL
ncbi:MAG: site-specific integrase [Gemmatimonadota bacterium]|nr:site-specific integrase [Gemmatimonadota bacterium]